jgi:arylsulfatase A-like enzyme
MNFQSVSVGQKLVEKSIGVTGGYADPLGTPSSALLGEIQFVDASIGQMAAELGKQGLLDSTLIIVTAKHGQSPIDPNRILRIPADNPAFQPPSAIVGSMAAQALEDDVSLIWLTDQSQTATAVGLLAVNEAITGGGEIFAGPSLGLLFSDPASDPRTPDIIVSPNVGVTYTGGTKKIAEHGGFANDDRNVIMLVSNPGFAPKTILNPVETRQVAPTVLKALGLNPGALKAVKLEQTSVLPGLSF